MKTLRLFYLAFAIFLFLPPMQAAGQQSAKSEVEQLKAEIERMRAQQEAQMRALQERLQKLEETQAPGVSPAVASVPAFPVQDGEKEITLPPKPELQTERGSVLEAAGLPRPEVFGARIGGFFVGSFGYNSHIQMVPEFAGGAPALADARRSNFRFDKFGLGVSKIFAPWLSASASMEIESHRDRHTHLIPVTEVDNRRGCPIGIACERFGAEDPEIEVTLDKFAITGIAPLGDGLSLSLGRYDVPFGIERHDEPLLLTATTSEVFRYGRPNRMTGFQTSYTFAPWLDVSGWVVNRWEAETTDDDFNDNNRGKSFGGRIGLTPITHGTPLNVGIGGFYGPEQDEVSGNKRWVLDLDFTWTPVRELLLAGEFVYGREDDMELRERGTPFASPARTKDVSWKGFYLLGHYDLYDWLGLSLRYGLFRDSEGGRTGVEQTLQSWTFAPIVHLSRLIPELRPMGAAYARTRHLIDWLDLKLEYRINHSNKRVFSIAEAGTAILDADKTGHQFQTQIVVNY